MPDHLDQIGVAEVKMSHVSIAKAKAQFAELVARAEAGEDVVITRNGTPVARIAPLPSGGAIIYG